MSSTLESYELIRFAEAFEARIASAGEMLADRPGLDAEKGWLATALELVRTARAPSADVLDRVKDLPELEEAREEYAFHQQGLWVDALEKLHAGITFTASSRAPVIEALFPHLKFPQLRRAPRDVIIEYATSYERRTRSAYVTRIFAREDFAMVRPVMEQVVAAHTAWRSSHEPAPLTPEVETVLREELVALGRKLDVALRQARLLSEAALVPVPSVHEAAGLNLKPKRRAGRGLALADDGVAGLDAEPVDSMEPTEAELAEVAALDAGGPEHDLSAAAAATPAAAPSPDATPDSEAPTVDEADATDAIAHEATAPSLDAAIPATEESLAIDESAPSRPASRKKSGRTSDDDAAPPVDKREAARGRKAAGGTDAASDSEASRGRKATGGDDAASDSEASRGRKATGGDDAASDSEASRGRKAAGGDDAASDSKASRGRKAAGGDDAASDSEASRGRKAAGSADATPTDEDAQGHTTSDDERGTNDAHGRKQSSANAGAPQESGRAQSPRVRKKKGSPDTAGTETP
ncbi:hypothetical protein LY474_39695 [Myxococcus stipitatus]|uniref:hypothetical protein n=1 Tax=Myxococcus stipitatus TaxID=83455 RepID=UPI001F268D38|nr:hypothetical protein [Myxococcus stipitatus]MCE9673937.1 hypothetical protein [Myxococcus stipitatus]